jgi:hypothetical protein
MGAENQSFKAVCTNSQISLCKSWLLGIGSHTMEPSSCQKAHTNGAKSGEYSRVVGQWTQGMPVFVLSDGWHGAWHCHAAPTHSVPICLCATAVRMLQQCQMPVLQDLLGDTMHHSQHSGYCRLFSADSLFHTFDSTAEGHHLLEDSTVARCCSAKACP